MVAQRFGSIWPSCAPRRIVSSNEMTVPQLLPCKLHPLRVECRIELGDHGVRRGGIIQVILPSLQRCAHKFGDNIGMLLDW